MPSQCRAGKSRPPHYLGSRLHIITSVPYKCLYSLLIHRRPLAALEDRASGAIGHILSYLRRDDGVVWREARAPVDSLTTPKAEFGPIKRGQKKRAVPAVGRTILLPIENPGDGGVI